MSESEKSRYAHPKAAEWLDDWLDQNLASVAVGIDLKAAAESCYSAARSAGFDIEEINKAAGGSLPNYLSEQQKWQPEA